MVRAALWRDRSHAGRALAQQLSGWSHKPNALVVGLPRGGIVVAAEIARQLQLPLASWAVRKLAHPQAPELALGAIAPGGVQIWDEATARAYRLDPPLRQRIVAEQRHELERRQRLYGDPPAAALQSLRLSEPSQLVLAVPVIDRRVADALRPQLDHLVALAEVDDLWAVGAWYQRFEPVSDTEVLRLMAACNEDRANSGAAVHRKERSDLS